MHKRAAAAGTPTRQLLSKLVSGNNAVARQCKRIPAAVGNTQHRAWPCLRTCGMRFTSICAGSEAWSSSSDSSSSPSSLCMLSYTRRHCPSSMTRSLPFLQHRATHANEANPAAHKAGSVPSSRHEIKVVDARVHGAKAQISARPAHTIAPERTSMKDTPDILLSR